MSTTEWPLNRSNVSSHIVLAFRWNLIPYDPLCPICSLQIKFVKIADKLEANANEQARGPPWKGGESGENGKLVKIADNLEANANERARGPPWKVGQFGNVVEIANDLEAHVHEQTRGSLGNLTTFV